MNLNYRQFIPAGILFVGVLLISGMRKQYDMKPLEHMTAIPTTFAGVTGSDTTIDAEEQRIAGMSDFVLRTFRGDSATNTKPFSIYVGYYDKQVQGKTIHSPKNCLPGAGWEIVQNGRVALDSDTKPIVNRVLLTNQGHRALVYYWYQGRGRIASNEYRVKWDLLRDAAMYGRTEEALVRIVLPLPPLPSTSVDAAVTAADSLAQTIAVPLAAAVYKVLPPFRQS
jgi:EpsI family protein